jgi:hypothetical protein
VGADGVDGGDEDQPHPGGSRNLAAVQIAKQVVRVRVACVGRARKICATVEVLTVVFRGVSVKITANAFNYGCRSD